MAIRIPVFFLILCFFVTARAQTKEYLPYGKFESWTVRDIKESAIIGGATRRIYNIGPVDTIRTNRPYPYTSRTPWASSNAYAKNSRGRIVKIQEEGWAPPDATPTHAMLIISASINEAFVGTIGNTLWVDNIALEY